MKIDKVEIRKIFLPYKNSFKTSGWVENGNSGIIIKVYSEGLIGWGESPVGKEPYYLEETTSTVWSILQEILIPKIIKKNFIKPDEISKTFSSVRGNNFAIAGLEFALWDLLGKANDKSLSEMLGGTRKKIDVGVSIGIQKNIETLLDKISEYLKEGYKRIKIKIKPGWDVEPLEAIRKKWENIPLQVDANSIYKLEDAEHLKELDEFNLLLIEQPLAYNDIYEHSILQKKIKTPVCLDESIISFNHAKWAIEINACKIINIKPGRVGGLFSSKKIHDLTLEKNIPVWCGGMLETGIGRSVNAALASLTNFKLPGDISANERYFERDIVLNPFKLNSDGTLNVPDKPGIGAEADEEFLDKITLEKIEIK